MDVTPRKRAKILTLKEHTSKNQHEIAKECGVNQSTVSRILKLYCQHGSATPLRKGRCGRKKATTPMDDRYLLHESKVNPRKTSSDRQKSKETTKKNVSEKRDEEKAKAMCQEL